MPKVHVVKVYMPRSGVSAGGVERRCQGGGRLWVSVTRPVQTGYHGCVSAYVQSPIIKMPE